MPGIDQHQLPAGMLLQHIPRCQYTPVASITTNVTPSSASHRRSVSRSALKVPNSLTFCARPYRPEF